MTDKIEKLTPEQEEELVKWRAKWLAVGTCTDPADRPRAEAAIKEMYTLIEEEPPEFRWIDGPAQMKPLSGSFWGQHEAHWIAFYLFCADVLGVEYEPKRDKQLRLWAEVARSCGWWWPYRGSCVISERPEVQKLDERGLVHCSDGPAIRCRDGWEVYAIHGVRVPQDIVMHPEQITVKWIDRETNVEIRRVMIDQYGPARFMKDADAVEVHRDHRGVLYRREVPGDEPIVAVEVQDPGENGKKYLLRVPPTMTRAAKAVAWTFGLEEAQYEPEVES